MESTVAFGLLLWLTPSGEGGRRQPIALGRGDPGRRFRYRPGWRLPTHPAQDQVGAPVFGFDRDVIRPGGEPAKAIVVLPRPGAAEWLERVDPGAALLMYEGSSRCGTARVVWRRSAHWPVPDGQAALYDLWLAGGPDPTGCPPHTGRRRLTENRICVRIEVDRVPWVVG